MLEVSVFEEKSKQNLTNDIRQRLKRPDLVCIGTEKVFSDSLGPRVGSMLNEQMQTPAFIYGVRSKKITAENLSCCYDFIKSLHPTEQIVVIDAAVGTPEQIGNVQVSNGGLVPGAATNKNLEEAINNGAFRMDLYYRLNVFNIHVPPLRERGGDVSNLAHYFLQKYKTNSHQAFVGFTPEALNALMNYNWPGNIRELENTIERAVILGRSERIRLDDLPEKIRSCYDHRNQTLSALAAKPPVRAESALIPFTPEETEKDAITRALRSTNGNVTRAAEQLGFSRRTMYRKMKKYDIM